jgi:membrane fusion protein (multidrug efflux system)
MAKRKVIRNIYNTLVIILLLWGVVYLCSRFIHFGDVEYTDNAQVFRHITPVNTRVQGYIKKIYFEEYQYVHKGDTLAVIEDSEYRLQLAQAEANLANATSGRSVTSAGIATTQSNIHTQMAGVDEAKVNMDNAERDYKRYAALLQKDAVTRQQYDDMKTAYEAARDRYEQTVRQQHSISMAKNEQTTRLSQNTANIRLAQAAVNLAKLNLSYTVILATADGVMGRKEIHEGQLMQPGQPLATITDDTDVWVIANYRETQLNHIKVGAKVKIAADAIPDVTYEGTVQSIASATGTATSVVPQDNATGNFVKVEQRVPVRISLKGNSTSALRQLLTGLNVECEVKY